MARISGSSPRELPPHERLVDQDRARVADVGIRDEAAANRDAERGEVAGRHRPQLDLRPVVARPAGDVHVANPAPVLQRHHLDEAGRDDAGNLAHPLLDGEVIAIGSARREVERHDVVGDDAGVGPAELMQFAHDAGDAAGEHECQGHLGHDQPIAHAAVSRRHGGAASGLLRDAADVGARRDQRRQQPDRHGHRDAGAEEEGEGAPVEGDLVRARNSCGAGA